MRMQVFGGVVLAAAPSAKQHATALKQMLERGGMSYLSFLFLVSDLLSVLVSIYMYDCAGGEWRSLAADTVTHVAACGKNERTHLPRHLAAAVLVHPRWVVCPTCHVPCFPPLLFS